MNKKFHSTSFQISHLIVLTLSILFGQHIPTKERGDPNFRRQTDIDGNKVRTSIFNFGLTGRTGAVPGEIPYEWPINSGKHYIALTGLFVGAEVLPENSTEAQPFVTTPLGRTDNQGNSMMFEPVPEYLNPNSNRIAKSDEPETWPLIWPDKMEDESDPGWPGAWNGFFGKDQFNADQEIYFKLSDDRNFLRGATYIPDTTDITRRGIGILSGVRVMEWAQVLVEDVVFILYEIKNDGTKDLNKVSFCLWLADLVGGDGDSGDDQPDFDLLYDIAWSMDSDGIGNAAFGSDRVGVAATAYLETPGNAIDRIDNDGDGETNGPLITEDMLAGEDETNAIDDNYNGLIDENQAHIPFGDQDGVTYANRIDDNNNAEMGSPTITQAMIDDAADDFESVGYHHWYRWPPNPKDDAVQRGRIHLIMLDQDDLGKAFADGIDNDESLEYPDGFGADTAGPRITWDIIAEAALDSKKVAGTVYYYPRRYKVPGTNIILYDVDSTDYGKRYADGIDNDGDGAIDEGIDEGIDEMIDESRDDHIDNDLDWNLFLDDVGRDGDLSTIDIGQNDQRPSSGSGSNLPGEPNIDKTDVSESDQMGLTAVAYDDAGGIPTNQDAALWLFYMMPGDFWQPPPGGLPQGDYDLFVTSAFFPIKAGDTERISMAVALGENKADAIRNKDVAQQTYNEDYQFAKAPIPPNVKAIPGDGRVTLTWDDIAEFSYDDYMYELGYEGYDFEGYKIYKATDAEFADVYNITDAQGNLTFYSPIAQFDRIDGKEGFHAVAVNGVHYWLGDESGIQHTFIDSNVVNGQTYYYTVVAYDFGGPDVANADTIIITNIPPTESTKRITVNPLTGEVRKGPNVVVVTPNPPVAGYTAPEVDKINPVQGTTSSVITYRIVDPLVVRENHRYRITFEDTLKPVIGPIGQDTLTTKNYSLFDVTNPDFIDTLIYDNTNFSGEQPVVDGFQLAFFNDSFVWLNSTESHWSADSLWRFVLELYKARDTFGKRIPADYRIEIGTAETGLSTYFEQDYGFYVLKYQSVATNFKVKKQVLMTGVDSVDWVEIPYAYGDFSPYPTGGNNLLDADSVETDVVIFLDDTVGGDTLPTWIFKMDYPRPTEELNLYAPMAGDTVFLIIHKPFLTSDIFEFTTISAKVDKNQVKAALANIKVVPNPYIASVPWEPRNLFTSGRGPRSIHFNHLPQKCTIRIFTVSGELVKLIRHDSPINNGTAEWDLLTKDNLSAAYGVYVYHVEAEDPVSGKSLGDHIGKFAVIK